MTQQKTSPFSLLLPFHKAHPLQSAIFWLISALTSFFLVWNHTHVSWLGFIVQTPPLALFCIGMLATFEHQLKARIAAGTSSPKVEVVINGVTYREMKCEMNDATYAKILLQTTFDGRLYGQQGLNILTVACNLISQLIVGIPAIGFWLVLAYYVGDQEGFLQNVNYLALHPATPHDIIGIVLFFGDVGLMGGFLCTAMGVNYFPRLGFINVFERACDQRIRSILSCPIEGRINVWPARPGKACELQSSSSQ